MKGDFSRSTFDAHKHYTGVRMQQGRVQLDADWNEQADILLHLITTQLQDLVGPGGTTAAGPGFAITLVEPADPGREGQTDAPTVPARTLPDFQIAAGRYYVDGMLCENEAPVLFSSQPDFPGAASLLQDPVGAGSFIVYLDVWQRHITAAEDPAIREVALGGPNTTTRIKTVWQARLLPLSGDPPDDQGWRDGDLRSPADWQAFLAQSANRGRLQARWGKDKGAFLENHLYRVEIHTAGGQGTFKWSRENGSVAFPVTAIQYATFEWPRESGPALPVPPAAGTAQAQEESGSTLSLTVEGLDRDLYQLQPDFWVELADDVTVLNGCPLPLCQVTEVEHQSGRVKLHAERDKMAHILAEIRARELRHPLLRRWEEDTRPIAVGRQNTASDRGDGWLDLENGIQVAFSDTGDYQAGDHWLIPARTRSEDGIEWPQKDGRPLARPPHGTDHHLSPLALLRRLAGEWQVHDLRLEFDSLTRVAMKEREANERLVKKEQEMHERLANLQRQIESVQARVDQEIVGMVDLADRAGMLQTYESCEASAGDVVALDPDHQGRVVLANRDNAALAVGVVAAVQVREGVRVCQVAQYGRVLCKVAGPVEPGDVLVPGEVGGLAVRAGLYIAPGTMVGKALAAHSGDAGPEPIEIMVTLR